MKVLAYAFGSLLALLFLTALGYGYIKMIQHVCHDPMHAVNKVYQLSRTR